MFGRFNATLGGAVRNIQLTTDSTRRQTRDIRELDAAVLLGIRNLQCSEDAIDPQGVIVAERHRRQTAATQPGQNVAAVAQGIASPLPDTPLPQFFLSLSQRHKSPQFKTRSDPATHPA
jgi:hypothetical protein